MKSNVSHRIFEGLESVVTRPERLVTLVLVLVALCGLFPGVSAAQVPVILAPVPQLQFFDQSGRPLAFGCLFTYQVASTTPLGTYTDYTGTTLNPNPVPLSAGGSANVWLQAGQAYTFRVKSAGGTNCSAGSTLYTVNGIGGGASTLTTVITYSTTPAFQVSAQNQLFELLLTGDASAQPLTFVGITPPSVIFFQITQDASGGHAFSWPANSVGGCTIGSAPNQVTTQEFVYNGTNATAVGPCVIGQGPAIQSGTIVLSGYLGCFEQPAPAGVPGQDILWCDSTAHRLEMNNNDAGADVVVGANTTDTFTNKTLDTAATGNVLAINGNQVSAVTGSGPTVVLQTAPTIDNPTLAGFNCPITVETSAYALLASDCIVQASASGAGYSLTLPHALTGQNWTITRTDSTVANTLTIVGDSGNVNGKASITLPVTSTIFCHADGTNSWCATSQRTQRTCVTAGCYVIDQDGTITEWLTTGSLNNNTATTVTLPFAIPTTVMSITCTDNGGRVQSGNNQPVGANVSGQSAPYSNFSADTPATGVTAYCTITGF